MLAARFSDHQPDFLNPPLPEGIMGSVKRAQREPAGCSTRATKNILYQKRTNHTY